MSNKVKAEFNGPAQTALFNKYGDPRSVAWESKFMTMWDIAAEFPWFPSKKLYVHRDFLPRLRGAFKALQLKGLHTEIKSCDGCFNQRRVRGSAEILSTHAWGAAIDLNAKNNPLGSLGKWTLAFVTVMTENGIYAGANWIGRKDPMHFSLVNG